MAVPVAGLVIATTTGARTGLAGSQAFGPTGASNAFSRSASSLISDSEKPFMLSAVIKCPGPIVSATAFASDEDSTAFAISAISSGGTDPRLLISRA